MNKWRVLAVAPLLMLKNQFSPKLFYSIVCLAAAAALFMSLLGHNKTAMIFSGALIAFAFTLGGFLVPMGLLQQFSPSVIAVTPGLRNEIVRVHLAAMISIGLNAAAIAWCLVYLSDGSMNYLLIAFGVAVVFASLMSVSARYPTLGTALGLLVAFWSVIGDKLAGQTWTALKSGIEPSLDSSLRFALVSLLIGIGGTFAVLRRKGDHGLDSFRANTQRALLARQGGGFTTRMPHTNGFSIRLMQKLLPGHMQTRSPSERMLLALGPRAHWICILESAVWTTAAALIASAYIALTPSGEEGNKLAPLIVWLPLVLPAITMLSFAGANVGFSEEQCLVRLAPGTPSRPQLNRWLIQRGLIRLLQAMLMAAAAAGLIILISGQWPSTPLVLGALCANMVAAVLVVTPFHRFVRLDAVSWKAGIPVLSIMAALGAPFLLDQSSILPAWQTTALIAAVAASCIGLGWLRAPHRPPAWPAGNAIQ